MNHADPAPSLPPSLLDGPNEKDRQLLVEFNVVIEEYQRLSNGYKHVISDITAKMGAGMASYSEASAKGPLSVKRWQEYDLYCHFVAGLVGEGLSRLFAESEIERPWLGDQLSLSNHMGLFLQKTNIIRDYAEDCAEGRFFWPQECWGAPGADFATQADVAQGIVETSPGSGHYRPEGEAGERAMFVLSTMLLDAFRHATRALDYLSLLRNQSVFNFCAIPQVMAIATLNLMIGNADVFKRNVKIRKSQAVLLIIHAVNPRDVSYEFLRFAREIRKKISPRDPNFVKWSLELSKIEIWCETYYPSFVSAPSEGREPDARAIMQAQFTQERTQKAKAKALASGAIEPPKPGAVETRRAGMTADERAAADKAEQAEMIKFFIIIMVILCGIMMVLALAGWMIAWYIFEEGPDPLSTYLTSQYRALSASAPRYAQSLLSSSRQSVQSLRNKIEL